MSVEPVSATVLVVEDNQQVCRYLCDLLGELGVRTAAAETAQAALAILESSESVDLLLCDLTLPDGNGVELARKAAELRPGVAVLLMSGYDTAGLGFPSIQKPFEPEDLRQQVSRMLAR